MSNPITTSNIRIVRWSRIKRHKAVEELLRRPAFSTRAENVAREVLDDIRRQGDRAVARYNRQFDGVDLKTGFLRVTRTEIRAAHRNVDEAFKRSARKAMANIERFSKAGLRKNWSVSTRHGGRLGELFTPLRRVGVYIPAGEAPLASTALMTIVLARTAGVEEIVACSPAGKEGLVNPYVLYTMDLAGASEIYKMGGIQAIGAMAFGTETIQKVEKIAGPGGPYVTAAKRQVYGYVDLDLVAGPSEIAVLADTTASPRFVAADLLSQAEHGTGEEKALLVTTSLQLAREVRKEIVSQVAELKRASAIKTVLKKGTLLVVVDNVKTGIQLCNEFAPEHMELIVRRPRKLLTLITTAGAVFLGSWTPEVAGDFAAGPSHVLPTGGSARMFSGLTVDAFRRRTSVIEYSKSDLKDALPIIKDFSRVEGLDAHARSGTIRFEEE